MRYTKPQYFDKFRCAADRCPDTCCAGWQIVIDEESLKRYWQYRDTKGSFGSRLSNGIDWQESCFLQHRGRCTLLREDNLCELVVECGGNALCETCGRYPRHVEEFEGLREWSLSLSCPEAARMILEDEEPFRLLVEQDEEQDPLEEEFEDFDLLLFTQLEDARNVLFRMVQKREETMEWKLLRVLEMAEEIQQCIEEEQTARIQDVIRRYEGGILMPAGNKYGEPSAIQKGNPVDIKGRYRELRHHFTVFFRLEPLRSEWSEIVADTEKTLYTDFKEYEQIRQAFLAEFGRDGKLEEFWERFQQNLLLFFLYTYFCGAVYDDCAYAKAALSVFSVLFVGEFIMCRWYLADKHISPQQCVELAYRYAREVEHSDANLNYLEEWLIRNPFHL